MKRKLAAIMFTDIVGFSKIMRENESLALSILSKQESLINPLVDNYNGNIIKQTGDGYLIEFSSSVEAVECAIAMQKCIKEDLGDVDAFEIRIGIHLGDIVILKDDILGDGVNVAARIEPLARPGGICLTDAVYQSVKSKLDINPKRIDEVDLKHIDDKYTIYKLPNLPEHDDQENKDINLNFHKDKIHINDIKKLSSFKDRYISGFNFLKYYLLIIYLMFGLDYFLYGNDLRVLIFNISLYTFIMPLGIGKTEYKISFDDIRKVIPTLDNIIINDWWNGKYKIEKGVKNTMLYVGYGTLLHKKISERFNIKHFKLLLEIKIDGNTITIKGIGMKVSSILKNIKKASIYNKKINNGKTTSL
tara:strand:+ start:2563 stop:3645 length:1083 start_codon:yes stop_codon:yes gene_type:complete